MSRKPKSSRADSAARAAVAAANWIVDILLLLFVMVLLSYGIYSIWDNQQIYNGADASQYETYKPDTKNDGDSPSFDELVQINPDVFAWLDVYGTQIDYPVLWNEDSDKYLNMDPEGNFSLSGSLFLDNRNKKDFSDPKNIIYGHHMEKEKMFGSLDQFGKKKFFDSHRYGNLFFDNKNHGLAFFAFITGDAYDSNIYSVDSAGGTAAVQTASADSGSNAAFLQYIGHRAVHWRDMDVRPDDTLVLLSTCASGETNERYILVGVLTDQTYTDTFGDEADRTPAAVLRGIAGSIWNALPQWWYILAAALAAVIVFVAWRRKRRS